MLQSRRCLEINPTSEKLQPRMRSAELGMATMSGGAAVRLALLHLHELVGNTMETVFLAVTDSSVMVYVFKEEEGPQAVKPCSRLGSRRLLYYTALGKAYMSALSDEARRALIGELDFRRLQLTPSRTPPSSKPKFWRRESAVTESTGSKRAWPVLGHQCVITWVRLSWRSMSPGLRIGSFPKESEISPLVAETALAISRCLGYVDSSSRS